MGILLSCLPLSRRELHQVPEVVEQSDGLS
jgi:hypothetical protein